MATPKCLENIKNNKPVGSRPCTDPYCIEASYEIGVHCTDSRPPLNPDEPVGPMRGPNLNGPGKPGYCYCCCSCFGSYTPIEVRHGEYALARDIQAQEEVLAAGADLRWKPALVESVSTWETAEGLMSSMYFLRYSWDGDVREVIVSPDHPFLMEDGTLIAVQDLTKKPLRLRRADGGQSDVLVVAQGTYQGGTTSIQLAGDFNGRDLSGHLLNTNGLVTGDFKVQVYYTSQHLAAELVHEFGEDKETLPVGTTEYHTAFPDEAYARFVDDPGEWPKGFAPTVGAETRVPATAARYLTDQQARDIRRHATSGSPADTYPARALLYVFNLMRGLYPDVDFVLDWDNPVPNAYSWSAWGRQTVVVTGGLVRVRGLRLDGLSLIVSTMVSYTSKDVHCVGEADYGGLFSVIRRLWQDNLFIAVVESALPQIEQLFSHITKKHAAPNPADTCAQPGIACRLDSYQAALSMFPVPACARPRPAYFEVRDARAISETRVQITFSRTLNEPTAETIANYAFEPAVEIHSATVNHAQPALVVLDVAKLAAKTSYLVRISHVVSNDDVPLDPAHSTGAFMTN
jgi:hypothetical protein